MGIPSDISGRSRSSPGGIVSQLEAWIFTLLIQVFEVGVTSFFPYS